MGELVGEIEAHKDDILSYEIFFPLTYIPFIAYSILPETSFFDRIIFFLITLTIPCHYKYIKDLGPNFNLYYSLDYIYLV